MKIIYISVFSQNSSSATTEWTGFENDYTASENKMRDIKNENTNVNSKLKISQKAQPSYNEDFGALDVKSSLKTSKNSQKNKSEEDAWDMLNN